MRGMKLKIRMEINVQNDKVNELMSFKVVVVKKICKGVFLLKRVLIN